LLALALPARAQVGTYVAPRINTVFNQWVTNTGSYTFLATNWLNASGWHNVNWQISEVGTNNIGTNMVPVSIFGSAGSGNSYTNAAAGTNYVYTSPALLVWPNNLTATTTSSGTWTNLTQSAGDSWLWYKGTFTVTCTNTGSPLGGFYLQIDQIVTP
jgi:hypothetical protein